MIGPFFEIGSDVAPFKKALGQATFHLDAVNLDYGVYGVFINFGKQLKSNLFGGVGFARIHQTLQSTFSDLTGTVVRHIEIPSIFIGVGPQLVPGFAYCIVSNLHLTGETSFSLLVGKTKDHTHYQTSSEAQAILGITSPNRQTAKEHKRTQLVPVSKGDWVLVTR